MKKLLLAAILLAIPGAHAQDGQAVIDAVINQRNVCQNNEALAEAKLVTANKQITDMKAELDKANAKIKELTPAEEHKPE